MCFLPYMEYREGREELTLEYKAGYLRYTNGNGGEREIGN